MLNLRLHVQHFMCGLMHFYTLCEALYTSILYVRFHILLYVRLQIYTYFIWGFIYFNTSCIQYFMYEGCPSKLWTFVISQTCVTVILWYFRMCFYAYGTILHKYGWNSSLDNKIINLYLTVCRRERRTSIFLRNYSSPKGSVHPIKFRFCLF